MQQRVASSICSLLVTSPMPRLARPICASLDVTLSMDMDALSS